MDALIYTAVSGATRNLKQQQISANNLANANMQGFRADLESATSSQVEGDGYNSRYFVQSRNGGVDMTSAAVRDTGRELDISILGSGLIALQGAGREFYSRNGSMDIDTEGNLTIAGYPVLGEGGPITLPPYSSIAIGNDGTITIVPDDGNVKSAMDVDRIKLVDIPANQIRKHESGFLISNIETAPQSDDVKIVNKHLEDSNVSPIYEMVSTISLNRQFEAQIKMMKVAEDLAQAGNRLISGQ